MSDKTFIELTSRDLLKIWNLEEYASAFESNCIEAAEFESLLESEWKETLESLIPFSGHRMRFMKNVKNFVKIDTNEMIENNFLKLYEKDKNKNTVISFSPQPGTSNESEDIKETKEILKNNDPEENLEESFDQEAPKNIAKKRKIELLCTVESDESNVTRGEQLRFLINKSATGRCLLQLAKQGSYLKDKDRNKLTDIIIENQLSKSDKISSTEFPKLVAAIQYLFPQEDSELYHIPYKCINGNKLLAKGKLITKYYFMRKELKAVGIIATKSEDQSDSQDDLITDDLQEKLTFLKKNVEPWPTIIDYWTDTSKQRIAQLHAKSRITNKENDKRKINKSKSNKVIPQIGLIQEKKKLENISTYLKKYPALKEKLGYILFEIDFDLLYLEQKLKAYNSYSEFCNRIMQVLNKEENKCQALKDNCLRVTNDEISEDSKNLVALLSLCYLDTVVTVARKSGRTWRPSHREIQEGIISQIESVQKLQTFIQEREKKLIHWDLTIQPYVLVCGSSIEDIDACYVILDRETQFLAQSPIRALDLCFKIIHAAYLNYSPESYRLWRLVQKELYDLTTEFDEWKFDAQLPKLFKKFSCK